MVCQWATKYLIFKDSDNLIFQERIKGHCVIIIVEQVIVLKASRTEDAGSLEGPSGASLMMMNMMVVVVMMMMMKQVA